MKCEKCQSEIADNSKFCPNCGNKFGSKKKKNFIVPTILAILVLFVATFAFCAVSVTKTSEYAIYKTCVSIKNHDYDKSLEYLNVDKIVNNRINDFTKEMYNDPELKDNPFAGLAYMFIDAMKGKFIETIKDSYKEMVEDSENIFKDVSESNLATFLVIKSYKNYSLKKNNYDKNKTTYVFSDNDKYKDINILMENPTGKHWEIIDIKGFNFWKNK